MKLYLSETQVSHSSRKKAQTGSTLQRPLQPKRCALRASRRLPSARGAQFLRVRPEDARSARFWPEDPEFNSAAEYSETYLEKLQYQGDPIWDRSPDPLRLDITQFRYTDELTAA